MSEAELAWVVVMGWVQSKSPAPRLGVVAPARVTVPTGTRKASSMFVGTSWPCRQYVRAGPGVRSRFNPPTTTGVFAAESLVTPWLAMRLMTMKTTNMMTATPRTAAAGHRLVVVVKGAFGSSLTHPILNGRWVHALRPGATTTRPQGPRGRRIWRRAWRRGRRDRGQVPRRWLTRASTPCRDRCACRRVDRRRRRDRRD